VKPCLDMQLASPKHDRVEEKCFGHWSRVSKYIYSHLYIPIPISKRPSSISIVLDIRASVFSGEVESCFFEHPPICPSDLAADLIKRRYGSPFRPHINVQTLRVDESNIQGGLSKPINYHEASQSVDRS
jgi:hypothetical protein